MNFSKLQELLNYTDSDRENTIKEEMESSSEYQDLLDTFCQKYWEDACDDLGISTTDWEELKDFVEAQS